MSELSVIVPTLDEASVLPDLLADLRRQWLPCEWLVADGGSQDLTQDQALAAGARLVRAARGRGAQMNAGARVSRSPWLLFLHADSRLESPTLLADALSALRTATAAAGHLRIAGHFALRFARERPGHDRFFRYLEGKTRSNRPGTINGDQGLLIAREWFETLGGFDETLPFLEDQRLAARIFDRGEWHLLPGTLVTSARRFEQEGHQARYQLMAVIMLAHAMGLDDFLADARRLYPPQTETHHAEPARYASLLLQRIAALPPDQHRAAHRRLGRFARDNAWQLAYALDVLMRQRVMPGPALRLFDAGFAGRANGPCATALATRLALGGLRCLARRHSRSRPA